jgi:hypothetical protein
MITDTQQHERIVVPGGDAKGMRLFNRWLAGGYAKKVSSRYWSRRAISPTWIWIKHPRLALPLLAAPRHQPAQFRSLLDQPCLFRFGALRPGPAEPGRLQDAAFVFLARSAAALPMLAIPVSTWFRRSEDCRHERSRRHRGGLHWGWRPEFRATSGTLYRAHPNLWFNSIIDLSDRQPLQRPPISSIYSNSSMHGKA